MEDDEEELLITELLEDPQLFDQLLLDMDIIGQFTVLNRLVTRDENGYKATVECLSVWQMQIGAKYCLEPLIKVLKEANEKNEDQLLLLGLQLLNQLQDLAPGTVARIRLRHELKELQIDDCLLHIAQRGGCEILEQINRWNRTEEERGIEGMVIQENHNEDASLPADLAEFFDRILLFSRPNDRLKESRLALLERFAHLLDNATTQTDLQQILAKLTNEDGNEDTKKTNKDPTAPTVHPAPPPPPPPPPPPIFRKQRDEQLGNADHLLPPALRPISLPPSGTKLRGLAWSKVPTGTVTAKQRNIWMQSANQARQEINLDLSPLDELFGCFTSASSSSSASSDSISLDPRRQSRRGDCVDLLSSKRSLNVNIFLKQINADSLIEALLEGKSTEEIGLEMLQALEKILPDAQELEIITAYSGDRDRLGTAERFFFQLNTVSQFNLRVRCMVLREELEQFNGGIRPSIDVIEKACEELQNSRSLRSVLYVLLQTGNYLNAGGFAGNAAGFRLNCLWQVAELRSNKPNLTLLHFVAMQTNIQSNQFRTEMPHLEEASKLSLETIRNETKVLAEKLGHLQQECLAFSTRFFTDFIEFCSKSKRLLGEVEKHLETVNIKRMELAEFFCEDTKMFKLEECFKIIFIFLNRFSKAVQENQEREERERKTAARQSLFANESTNSNLSNSASITGFNIDGNRRSFVDVLQDRSVDTIIDSCTFTRKPSRRRPPVLSNELELDGSRERTPPSTIIGRKTSSRGSRKLSALFSSPINEFASVIEQGKNLDDWLNGHIVQDEGIRRVSSLQHEGDTSSSSSPPDSGIEESTVPISPTPLNIAVDLVTDPFQSNCSPNSKDKDDEGFESEENHETPRKPVTVSLLLPNKDESSVDPTARTPASTRSAPNKTSTPNRNKSTISSSNVSTPLSRPIPTRQTTPSPSNVSSPLPRSIPSRQMTPSRTTSIPPNRPIKPKMTTLIKLVTTTVTKATDSVKRPKPPPVKPAGPPPSRSSTIVNRPAPTRPPVCSSTVRRPVLSNRSRQDSVSTAARPALIRTGTMRAGGDRPGWR